MNGSNFLDTCFHPSNISNKKFCDNNLATDFAKILDRPIGKFVVIYGLGPCKPDGLQRAYRSPPSSTVVGSLSWTPVLRYLLTCADGLSIPSSTLSYLVSNSSNTVYSFPPLLVANPLPWFTHEMKTFHRQLGSVQHLWCTNVRSCHLEPQALRYLVFIVSMKNGTVSIEKFTHQKRTIK